jgi:hypothetical protein
MKSNAVRKVMKPGWKERIRHLRAWLSGDPKKPVTQERFVQFIGILPAEQWGAGSRQAGGSLDVRS